MSHVYNIISQYLTVDRENLISSLRMDVGDGFVTGAFDILFTSEQASVRYDCLYKLQSEVDGFKI